MVLQLLAIRTVVLIVALPEIILALYNEQTLKEALTCNLAGLTKRRPAMTREKSLLKKHIWNQNRRSMMQYYFGKRVKKA